MAHPDPHREVGRSAQSPSAQVYVEVNPVDARRYGMTGSQSYGRRARARDKVAEAAYDSRVDTSRGVRAGVWERDATQEYAVLRVLGHVEALPEGGCHEAAARGDERGGGGTLIVPPGGRARSTCGRCSAFETSRGRLAGGRVSARGPGSRRQRPPLLGQPGRRGAGRGVCRSPLTGRRTARYSGNAKT